MWVSNRTMYNKGGVQLDKNTLSHTRWKCKYHLVFAPKFRRQIIYGNIKADVANIPSTLCKRKGVEIIEPLLDTLLLIVAE